MLVARKSSNSFVSLVMSVCCVQTDVAVFKPLTFVSIDLQVWHRAEMKASLAKLNLCCWRMS